ncbi:hypothetical protein ABT218_17505 [Streptomyces sp. NPDC001455]
MLNTTTNVFRSFTTGIKPEEFAAARPPGPHGPRTGPGQPHAPLLHESDREALADDIRRASDLASELSME